MDADGYNFVLTTYFSDGHPPVSERIIRAESVERYKKTWERTQAADAELGIDYDITYFEVEAL